MDTNFESKQGFFLNRATFKDDLSNHLAYFLEHSILEMRLALPVGLVMEYDEACKDLVVHVNWIDESNENLIMVGSCTEFVMSQYVQEGFKLKFRQRLTNFLGTNYVPKIGFSYYTKKGQKVIIERTITNIGKHFDNQLNIFVRHCNLFYILHCEPYNVCIS